MRRFRSGSLARRARRGRADATIIACVVLLVVIGLAMLASASSHLGQTKFSDPYYYLKHQIWFGLSLGIIGFIAGAFVPYHLYERISFVLLLVSIALLVLIFTPLGVATKGAARWLTVGPITFQPSEFLKLTFPLYLAAWLGRRSDRRKRFLKGFLPFLVVVGSISALLLAQHSTSSVAILMVTALVVYFVSGARLSYVFGMAALGVAGFALVVYLTPYRLDRVLNFIRGDAADAQAGGFHLTQARIAIGAGGLTGVGYGQSTTKINSLPEPIGDSLFAVIAEETGFIGSAILITLFLVLILRTFMFARRVRDPFGQLLLVGFGTLIALQTFVHIGAISGLIPLTGTPLPFMSYGGTALAVFMTMSGIMVNVSRYA